MNWIIGDIHGMVDEFKQVLALIDEKDKEAKIWCVGDYCDRGYNSKGVVDIILADREKFNCVRGNHDDVFHCIFSGEPTPYSDDQSQDAALNCLAWFSNYGMLDTFASYGKTIEQAKNALRGKYALKAFVADLPQEHVDFYTNLPLVLEGDDFFICHAYMPTGTTVTEALTYDSHRKAMIWGRFAKTDVNETKAWGKKGYFGHTPTYTTYQSDTPVFGDNIVLVDTGAVFGKHLSAVCHETQEVVRSTHESDELV